DLPLSPAVRRKQRDFPSPRLSWIQRAWTSHVEHREGASCRRCLAGTSLAWTFHAGLVAVPMSASSPQGTCESAMKAATLGSTSAAKEGRKLRAVKKKKSVLRRQYRWHRRSWNGVLDSRIKQAVKKIGKYRLERLPGLRPTSFLRQSGNSATRIWT